MALHDADEKISDLLDIDGLARMANDTRYGPGAGIYTTRVNKAHIVARKMGTGNVWIKGSGVMQPVMPFGGNRESSWGRDNRVEGISAYQQTESGRITLNHNDRA